MNTTRFQPSRRTLAARILPAMALLALPAAGSAATYTWSGLLTGTLNWNAIGNWGGVAFPNAIDDIANLTADFTGATTVNLNADTIVGTLSLDDTGASGDSVITIAAGSPAGKLIFDAGSGSASLTSAGATNVISAGIQLNDSLECHDDQ